MWHTFDENGNEVAVEGAAALKQVAQDVGELSCRLRTGGAPTFAVAMSNILHKVGGGTAMMGFCITSRSCLRLCLSSLQSTPSPAWPAFPGVRGARWDLAKVPRSELEGGCGLDRRRGCVVGVIAFDGRN